jgi:nucleoid-associated protein YgaU
MLPACRIWATTNGRSRLTWPLCLFPLLLAAPAYSQTLGDLARQERERKQHQSHRTEHVYTNDDLKRSQILRPEDRERVQEAQKKVTPATTEPAAEVAGSAPETGAESLGDIARRYRALQQAGQKPGPQPIAPQLKIGGPVLAYPTLSPPLAPPAAPPAPPRFVKPTRERARKSIPSEEPISGAGARVQPGDTLWKLAKEYLGHGTHWLQLAAINPQVTDPTRLRVGTWVRLPEKAQTLQSANRVRIQRGDSLWKLAQAQFGTGNAWSCIAQANPQLQNANLIFPGQTLTIPASCTATPFGASRAPRSSPRISAELH